MGKLSALLAPSGQVGRYLRHPWQQLFAGVLGIVLFGGALWWLFSEGELPPDEQLQQALQLLDQRDDLRALQRAKRIARKLHRQRFRDPSFAGGPEYVLGIVAFREAFSADEADQEAVYLRAIRYLKESEQQSLDEHYRPEWHFALGISLYEIGNAAEARTHLEQAVKRFPPGRIETTTRLVQVYLDRRRKEEMPTALRLIEEALQFPQLAQKRRDRMQLQKARVLLALGRRSEAEAALKEVSDQLTGSLSMRLFRAQARIAIADALASRKEAAVLSAAFRVILKHRAASQYATAVKELEPAARSHGLETSISRQAMFLQAVCARRLGELEDEARSSQFDQAINLFERTARDFPKTHEAVAASLHSGELLRSVGRDEESLQAFRRAMPQQGSEVEFHNRWIDAEDFRSRVLAAWNSWMERKSYPEAIELARMMPGLFPAKRAQELNAIAHEKWAEQVEATISQLPAAELEAKKAELRRRRRLTGHSYTKLATLHRTTSRYPEFLWTAAENFHRGHDFDRALEQLNLYINTRPKKNLPQALVMRGRTLMDLDRLEEAKEHFERVQNGFSTNPVSFAARNLLADCLLELQKPEQAEALWRKTLVLKSLTPQATEWQNALFALSRHLVHSAKILREQSASARRDGKARRAVELRDSARTRLREAVEKLEEYLARYPSDNTATQARFLLAKSQQELAAIAGELVAEAAVENARKEQLRRQAALLRSALESYRRLQLTLLSRDEGGRLAGLDRMLLRECYFEIAHSHMGLKEYDKAIQAYSSAATRYAQDPHVLLAYLQMANCNRRLGKTTEAFSLIVQAEVIFRKLPDSSFRPPLTALTRDEWQKWIQWAKSEQLTENNERTF